MDNQEWLEQARQEIAQSAVKKYRIDAETADELVNEILQKSPKLLKVIQDATEWRDVERSKYFKEAASSAKKRIYYYLRQYKQDQDNQAMLVRKLANAKEPDRELLDQLAETHASTRERMPSREAFYPELKAAVGEISSILDLGCGLQPLIWPFSGLFGTTNRYLALDKDPDCIRILQAFARLQPALQTSRWFLNEGLKALQNEEFDLALMLKFIPVLARQAREELPLLYQVPARYWAISGSKISLTKKESIEFRERKAIERFVRDAGRRVVAEFDAGEEFVVVAGKD
ncbi:MAG: hypothetical protein H6581_26600 [Bacteroidia bacterium]|nr:hypothetical protein [Bacteroidia bacterium]